MEQEQQEVSIVEPEEHQILPVERERNISNKTKELFLLLIW